MAADPLLKQRTRGAGKPFEKGTSGNPRGRTRGTRNRVTVLAETMFEDDGEKVARAVLDAAQGGDMTAARLVLERILPLRKGRPVVFPMPKIVTAEDAAKAIGSVAEAMANGTLSPDEAATVASVVELRRKAIELVEIEARLRALEGKA